MSQVNRHFPSNFQDLLNLNIKFDNNPSQSTAIKTDFDTIQSSYTNPAPTHQQMQNPYAGSQSTSYAPPNMNKSYAPLRSGEDGAVPIVDTGDLFDFKNSSHPVAAIFHILFKVLALFMYLFFDFFTSNQIFIFIFVIIFSAFDFWTVKNVSGRLMVGLRWWSEVMDDGSEKWHFECHETNIAINPIDRRLFWWTQMGAVGLWGLLTFFNIFKLAVFWGVCTGIALSLSATNYWGYHKCSKDQQNRMSNILQSQQSGIARFAWNTISRGYNFFGNGSGSGQN